MDYAGLLGQFQPDEEDRRRALQAGLLQAGLGILAGNTSRNLGPALGQGGLMGLQGYNQALMQGPQQRMAQLPALMKIAEMQREGQQREALSRVYGGGAGMQKAGGQPAGLNRVAAAEYLSMGGDPTKLKALHEMYEAKAPKPQLVTIQGPNGPVLRWVNPGESTGVDVGAPYEKPEAPKTRTVRIGGSEVTQEWSPATGWAEVGRGPAWNPNPQTVINNIPADGKRSEPFEVTVDGKPTMIRQDQRGRNYFAHNGEAVPTDVKITPKLSEAQKNVATGAQNTRDALGEYRKLLDTWQAGDVLSPDKRAAMGTVYNNAMLQAKEAYRLGVLNGPDYQILTSILTNPASWLGTVTSNRAMGEQATKLDEILGKIQTNTTGTPAAPAAPAAPTKNLMKGQVVNGFKYIGGDPAKQESWQKQ